MTQRRIGLLGGSFNPAHSGHLHISERALERLRLDAVWWLVSPQNPLKPAAGMAPLETRLEAARAVAGHPRILVTDIESELGTRYTIDTLAALKARFPGHRFVWLMGADILHQLPRWKGWRGIFRSVAIAVFARPSYSLKATSGRAARLFAGARVRPSRAGSLAAMRPPAWVFINTPRDATSAARIRAGLAVHHGKAGGKRP